jgi:hypothetical protein
MGRRTKTELQAANYDQWVGKCAELREKKKAGERLTLAEKSILKTLPTPEAPYKSAGIQPEDVPVKKKKPVMKKIDFDKNVSWPEKAQSFLCAVFNVPYTDEQCMLFCERDDCPFHGVGYFRSHGVKF